MSFPLLKRAPSVLVSGAILMRLLILVISFPLLVVGCDIGDSNDSQISRKVPKTLIAVAGARSVNLSWAGVAGADGYTLYWSNNPGVRRDNSAAIQISQATYLHLALNNDITYYYAVSSNSNSVESNLSDEVAARPEADAPQVPSDLRLKAEDSRISIEYDQINGVIQYLLLWQTGADFNLDNNPNQVELLSTPFVHTDLNNGQIYSYVLRITNPAGKSTDSAIAVATPQTSTPMAPVITDVIATSGQVQLTWTNTSNADSFVLFWGNDPTITVDSVYVENVNSPYTHAPLSATSNQHYYYRLQARNSAGVSVLSNQAHVITPTGATVGTAAARPEIPVGNGVEPLIKFVANDGQLTLAWANATATNTLGYNLYWLRGSSVIDQGVVLTKSTNSGVIRNIQSAYTHVGLQNNVYYYYRLSAINNAGESELSTATFANKPEVIVPGVPSGVMVLDADQSLSVRWNPVNQADSYTISIDGVAAANVTSPHTINELNNGQQYKISVTSVTATRPSPPSMVVTGTPQVAAPYAPRNLVAISGDGQARLQWDSANVPSAIVQSEATVLGYRVYLARNTGININDASLLILTPTLDAANNSWQVDVPDLSNGPRYYFFITALNNGGESRASELVWAMPQAPTPSAVTNVSALAGNNNVRLRFDPAENANAGTTYNLYWSKDLNSGRSPVQVITNIGQGQDYIFSEGNANGTRYNFQVSAISAGVEGVLSAQVSATPQKPAPITAPNPITAQASNTQIDISWNTVLGTERYVIYWSTRNDINPDTSASIESAAATRITIHPGLFNGRRYYYKVAAANAAGVGPLSSVVSAVPRMNPPPTPAAFALVTGDAQVTVNWAAVPTATRYRLFWRLSSSTTWGFVQGVQSGYVHRPLINGQSYDYYLLAQNDGGEAQATVTLQATPVAAAPAKPTGLSAASGNQQNTLRWFTQADLVYNLYWSSDPNLDPIDSGQVFSGIQPSKVHGMFSPLSNNVSYRYRVVAVNSNDNTKISVASDIVSATPQAVVADAPGGLSAQSGDAKITLNWFAPANLGSDTRYTLYWGTDANTAPTNAINSVQAPYVHTQLSNLQSYYYVVKAIISGSEGPASNIATATPNLQIPATVGNVAASPGEGLNTITWSPVRSAANYQLEWSINGAFNNAPSTMTIPASATSFVHQNLNVGQTVHYRLIARNSAGSSAYSRIVSATPIKAAKPNLAPVASELKISISDTLPLKIGDTLTGTYAYNDNESDEIGPPTIKWYRDTLVIPNANSASYIVVAEDLGKILRFEVTPNALSGTSPGGLQHVRINTLKVPIALCATVAEVALTPWSKPNACPSLLIPNEYADIYQLIGKGLYYNGYDIIEGINACAAIILDEYYLKDSQSVFFADKKIFTADPASFQALGYGFAKDNSKVWVKTGYRDLTQISQADAATFTVLGGLYSKDKNNVFFGENIVGGADPASASYVAESYAKDANFVYYHGGRHPDYDAATFQHLGSNYYRNGTGVVSFERSLPGVSSAEFVGLGDNYGRDSSNLYYQGSLVVGTFNMDTVEYLGDSLLKDDNNVYYRGQLIQGADAASFINFENSGFSKDNNNVYNGKLKFDGVDAQSFVILSGYYSKDAINVYDISYKVKWANPDSFVTLGNNGSHGKDNTLVFSGGRSVECADIASFETLSRDYSRDKFRVFRKGGEMAVADPNTIEPLGGNYAKDANTVFYYGGVLANADPTSFKVISRRMSRDSTTLFNQESVLSSIDSASFTWLGRGFFKDNNTIFSSGGIFTAATDVNSFRIIDETYSSYDGTISGSTGVDLASFQVLGNGYATDINNAYHLGSIITGASVTGFQVLFDRYSKDTTNIYFNQTAIVGSIPATFEKVFFEYSKDSGSVYFDGINIAADPATFNFKTRWVAYDASSVFYSGGKLAGIDPTNFEILSYAHTKGTNKVYYGNGEIGGTTGGVDAATFELIPASIRLSRDINNMYNTTLLVPNSDPASFVQLGYNIGKDNNNVYENFNWGIVTDADGATFELVGESSYGKDVNRVYYRASPRMVVVDTAISASFIAFDFNRFGKDEFSVFYENTIVVSADPGSFEQITSSYYKDTNSVFYNNNSTVEKILGAEPANFVLIAGNYYRDSDQVFLNGREIPGANPDTFDPLNP